MPLVRVRKDGKIEDAFRERREKEVLERIRMWMRSASDWTVEENIHRDFDVTGGETFIPRPEEVTITISLSM